MTRISIATRYFTELLTIQREQDGCRFKKLPCGHAFAHRMQRCNLISQQCAEGLPRLAYSLRRSCGAASHKDKPTALAGHTQKKIFRPTGNALVRRVQYVEEEEEQCRALNPC